MDKTPDEDLLKALTADRAACWIDVAETLAGLEALSRVSQNGRAWHDVMKDHLATLGLQISSGHIYKIRRAYSFLKKNVPPGTSIDQLRRVKVSAVEVSERLFRLDPAAGLRALHDAVADDPTPYVELQARYESALAAQPEMKSRVNWPGILAAAGIHQRLRRAVKRPKVKRRKPPGLMAL